MFLIPVFSLTRQEAGERIKNGWNALTVRFCWRFLMIIYIIIAVRVWAVCSFQQDLLAVAVLLLHSVIRTNGSQMCVIGSVLLASACCAADMSAHCVLCVSFSCSKLNKSNSWFMCICGSRQVREFKHTNIHFYLSFALIPDINAIQYTQLGLWGWNIGTHLSHKTDQGHLTNVGALSSHIRAGNYHSSLAITLDEEKGE